MKYNLNIYEIIREVYFTMKAKKLFDTSLSLTYNLSIIQSITYNRRTCGCSFTAIT